MELSWVDLGVGQQQDATPTGNTPKPTEHPHAPYTALMSYPPPYTVSEAVTEGSAASGVPHTTSGFASQQFTTTSPGEPYASPKLGSQYTSTSKGATSYAVGSSAEPKPYFAQSQGPSYAAAQASTTKFSETKQSPLGKGYTNASFSASGYILSSSSRSYGYAVQASSSTPYSTTGHSTASYTVSY